MACIDVMAGPVTGASVSRSSMIETKESGRGSGRFVTTIACTIAALGGVVLAVIVFGSVRGEEFAADRFRRRSFSYYQIPLIQLQVSPVGYDTVSNDLTTHLRKNGLIGSPNQLPERWDLVALQNAGRLTRRGDAAILTQYLDTVDSGEKLVWLEWSRDHPQLAKELWPVVASLARKNLYPLVPDVLRKALHEEDPNRLKAHLQEHVAEKLLVYANAESNLDHHDLAVEYYSMALDHQPENPTALRGRADSLDALGKRDHAMADRRAADEIDETEG